MVHGIITGVTIVITITLMMESLYSIGFSWRFHRDLLGFDASPYAKIRGFFVLAESSVTMLHSPVAHQSAKKPVRPANGFLWALNK